MKKSLLLASLHFIFWNVFSVFLVAADLQSVVLGRGVERFEIGPILYQDDFGNLDRWVVQVEEKDGFPEALVEARDGALHCFLPGRGCTVWFREKMKTRLSISYEVICPEATEGMRGVVVKDVNNFWLASDVEDKENGLFDSDRYYGNFSSYDKMHGYYASSGGGKNTTTRMRRYPRKRGGKPVAHIALTERDGQEEFLLTPGKKMKVQLVAFDDFVQYIVDGKLVYEMAAGDDVGMEVYKRGKKKRVVGQYDPTEYPVHKEGFFGFRMVGTHHIYSNFRVHELVALPEREKVVSSIAELQSAAALSDQNVVMKPGHYLVEDVEVGRPLVHFTGSRNHFDLTGVTIEMPIAKLREMGFERTREMSCSYLIRGHEVVLKGGRFVNSYASPLPERIDFGAYNQDSDHHPIRSMTEIVVRGNDVLLQGCEVIVRGSSPYGYGNMFGIGPTAVIPLYKHSGILVRGDRAVLDGCQVKMEAFGHAIFTQRGDDITVKNCRVEGGLRASEDFLNENDDGDLGKKYDHKIQWPKSVRGLRVPKNHMINLCEDGIRAYKGTGKITVENCQVSKTRGGIKLYMAKSAMVRNCEVRDCVVQGYSVPSRGVIENCRGNAAYGPLLYIHSDGHNGQKIEIEVIPAPHGVGDHVLAAIKGRGHQIRFTTKSEEGAQLQRPIVVGYPMRFDYLSVDFPAVPAGMEGLLEKHGVQEFVAENITLNNETSHPIVLGKYAQKNRTQSKSAVKDLGKRNVVE